MKTEIAEKETEEDIYEQLEPICSSTSDEESEIKYKKQKSLEKRKREEVATA